nr:MAG TPA: hypothetical protein [Caudoviricetes sp.]
MGKFVVGERYKVGEGSNEAGNIIEITKIDRTWCYYKTVEGEHAPDSFMPNSQFSRTLIPVAARKFKVGDKVIGNDLADGYYGITSKGYKGIVTDVLNNGKIKVNQYTVLEECFDLSEEKIVITCKGNKTIAKYYINGAVMEKGLARCCPEDTFDFATGAKIAFDRMFGFAKPTLETAFDWNGFIKGDIFVEVTRETIADFLKECEKNDCNWYDHAATEWNPFESYDSMPEELKGVLSLISDSVPSDKLCIHMVDGNLMFCNHAPEDGSKVVVWEKSFDWEAFKDHKISVKVTAENKKSFMEEAEKNSCKWRTGHKPTEWNFPQNSGFIEHDYGMYFSSEPDPEMKVIEW